MKNIELGISLYPEQETAEEIRKYIETASRYGFSRIFTSIFSIPGEKEEVLSYLKKMCDIAHCNGMRVIGDCNPSVFKKLGGSENDLSVYKEIGIDGLRMDAPFGDERDITLINNPYGIQIVNSTAMMPESLDQLIDKCGNEKISVCHNFYPQRYTGISFEDFERINKPYAEKGIKVEAFISSNVPGAHGPWPVWDGLVTVEEMRDLPIEAQTRIYLQLGTVDIITISNAFASKEELKAVRETLDYYNEDFDHELVLGGVFKIHLSDKRHILDIIEDEGVTETEKKLVYDCKVHMDLGDGFNYNIRSRMTRFGNKDLDIPYRDPGVPYFKKGDVLIVNNNCRYYMGEVQIVLKDMKNDGQRNRIGHVDEREMLLIDRIGPREPIRFKKEN